MQELNDAQKLEVDAYYIRPKTANERMKAAQSTGNLFLHMRLLDL